MAGKTSDLLVTLIQADLHWEEKRKNLDMFEEKIRSLQTRAEIVVLPEMFSTGFSMNPQQLAEPMSGSSVEWMKRVSAEYKIILTGSLIIEEAGKFYNRLIWMLPNGSFGYYDKRHLFGYAGEDQKYQPGTKRLVASVKGWKINLQVCYDLRFPVWARQSAPTTFAITKLEERPFDEPEFDVLVYVANWPEKRSHAWKTLLQARAIENQSYVVGVNRVGNDGNGIYHSGDSMIVDPMGQVLKTASGSEAVLNEVLQIEKLNETRSKLPFLKDADRFFIEI